MEKHGKSALKFKFLLQISLVHIFWYYSICIFRLDLVCSLQEELATLTES